MKPTPPWKEAIKVWRKSVKGYQTNTRIINNVPEMLAEAFAGNKIIADPYIRNSWIAPTDFIWEEKNGLWEHRFYKDKLIIYKS